MTTLNTLDSLKYAYPETALAFVLVLVILLDLVPAIRQRRIAMTMTITGLLLTLIATLVHIYVLDRGGNPHAGYSLFHGMIVFSRFTLFFKVIFVLTALLVALFSIRNPLVKAAGEGEYCTLLLTGTLGCFLMAAASDFLMVYLSIELVSIASYVMVGFYRKDRKSAEAALKYVIYGAVASGLMIFGLSFLYGLAGSTQYGQVYAALAAKSQGGAVSTVSFVFSFLLVLAGFGYKIACFPFHMWCPDVYEGAPTPITAFLSVGPKAAGIAALVQFFYANLSVPGAGGTFHALAGTHWPWVLALVSVATMTVGNLGAVPQTNVKRMLAYSSIAHAGYLLMPFVMMTNEGLQGILLYLVVYLLMNMGAFLALIAVAEKGGGEELKDFRGLGWKCPTVAVPMAIFLFSLTGLPPLAGFIGKVWLFMPVIEGKWYWLAVAGVLNSVVSLYYYAKVVRAMFLEGIPSSSAPPERILVPALYSVLLWALAVPTVGFGIFFGGLSELAKKSAQLYLGH